MTNRRTTGRWLAALLLSALALAATADLQPRAAHGQADLSMLSLAAEATVREPAAKASIQLAIAAQDHGEGTDHSSSLLTSRLIPGIGLLVIGGLLMGVALRMGGWYKRKGAGVMAGGLVGFAAGVALVISGLPGGGAGGDELRNPMPATEESIQAGLAVYEANCLSCHGETGQGDGPAAAGMDPPPADLRVHAHHHPDAMLFGFVRDGIPDTPMAPLGDVLTAHEIWHLINYIKTFE